MATLRFLGAAGTVTGSKHLLSAGEFRLLVDCGLFQGAKAWRERNWAPFPAPIASLSQLILTHAHLDHTGYLPRLARLGYRGPVACTAGTAELAAILLPDSGRLQEEDAEFHNRHNISSHQPALPLYTEEDARAALKLLRAVPLEQDQALAAGGRAWGQFRLHRAAHILGSAMVDVTLAAADGAPARRVVFTGDVGRLEDGGLLMAGGPAALDEADYLVMESTYGDRLHPHVDISAPLAAVVGGALGRGGVVVVPAFAIERTEKLLFLLKHLIEGGAIPRVPVHMDSPMAIAAMDVFLAHGDEFDADTRALIARYGSPHTWPELHFDSTQEQSRALNNASGPMIILSSSGMATGGRILHHLAQRLPDERNLVVFVGYQSPGTLGQLIRDGRNPVLIHRQAVPVRAQIAAFEQFSDHADYQELLSWLGRFRRAPRATFLVHGDPAAAAALQSRITAALGWRVQVAEYLQEVELD